MKAEQIRSRSDDQLDKALTDLYREQFNLRAQRATGQLGNPARFKAVRRDIARIKTVLNERKRKQA